jgi:hypothetical protein
VKNLWRPRVWTVGSFAFACDYLKLITYPIIIVLSFDFFCIYTFSENVPV